MGLRWRRLLRQNRERWKREEGLLQSVQVHRPKEPGQADLRVASVQGRRQLRRREQQQRLWLRWRRLLRGKCERWKSEEGLLQSVQVHRPKEQGRQAGMRVASVQGRRQLRRREQQQRLWLRWRRLLRGKCERWKSEEGL